MRQLIIITLTALIAIPVFAQEQPAAEEQQAGEQEYYYEDDELFQEVREGIDTVTHAELAVMVLQILAGDPESVPGPTEAFATALNRGLIPSDWAGSDILTHGELAEFLRGLGAASVIVLAEHNPPSPDEPVSRAYVEVMLHRALGKIKDRYRLRLGGEQRYRGVSAATFQ
jgi:hypothetical protein